MMLGYIVFKIVMALELEDVRQVMATGAGEEMKGLLDELDKLAVSELLASCDTKFCCFTFLLP